MTTKTTTTKEQRAETLLLSQDLENQACQGYRNPQDNDENNAAFLFNGIDTDLLVRIAAGEINAQALAELELAKRGMNQEGKWVGFDEAKAEFINK